MFYSHTLLSRKGAFGNIWIAAYCFRKLRKQQIEGTNIPSSVDKIMLEVQISHRVLAQLLLGIVKIFSKQVDYLYDECDEALTKIRKSFTSSLSRGTTCQKAKARTGNAAVVNGEAISAQKRKPIEVEENTTLYQIETMRSAYPEVCITLPERFELDSFDLGTLDNTDIGRTHQQATHQDECTDDFIRPSFLNECFGKEPIVPTGDNYTCFTPLADVLPCSLMDVDLELIDLNRSSTFASAQKTQDDLHQKGESEKHILSVSVSRGNSIHDDISDSQILSKMDQFDEQRSPTELIQSEKDKTVQFEEQRYETELKPLDSDKTIEVEERRNQSEATNLKTVHSSEIEEANVIKEHHFDALSPKRIQHKSDLSGSPSPTFKISTPTIKERPRISKKRKKNMDGIIILSNEFMRQMIHDASDIVCKRRKAPHTDLDAWRSQRLLNIYQSFMEPLITMTSLEMKWLPQKKLPEKSPDTTQSHLDAEMRKHPQKKLFDDLKDPAENHIDPTNERNGMPYRSVLVQEKQLTSIDMFDKEFPSSDTSDFEVELMNIGSHEDVIDQDHEWSARTRAAARYLYKKFVALRDKNCEEILNLAEIVEGKPRPKCARLFYETLSLKTHSCINVTQDHPYADIYLSAAVKLQIFH